MSWYSLNILLILLRCSIHFSLLDLMLALQLASHACHECLTTQMSLADRTADSLLWFCPSGTQVLTPSVLVEKPGSRHRLSFLAQKVSQKFRRRELFWNHLLASNQSYILLHTATIFWQDHLRMLKCCLLSAVVQFQGPLGLEHLRRSLDFSQDVGLTDAPDFMSVYYPGYT